MEEILRKLQKEASGSKYKAIKESCTWASETLESLDATTKIPRYQLREKCLLPLQLALESKNMKLAQQSLAGMQKLLSDERFVSMETDSDDKQLLNQMLNAVRVTPSLNEDLQVEVMKIHPPDGSGLLHSTHVGLQIVFVNSGRRVMWNNPSYKYKSEQNQNAGRLQLQY